jgi:magnesium transporter
MLSKKSRVRKERLNLDPASPELAVKRPNNSAAVISVHVYNEKSYNQFEIKTFAEFPGLETDKITWINVSGSLPKEEIEQIGRYFNLHHLLVEDVIHSRQRSKVEDYTDHLFLAIKKITYNKERKLKVDQISIILSGSLVLSFNECAEENFEIAAGNLSANKGPIRKRGADYLLYTLLDITVDNYFITLEELEGSMERVETQLLTKPKNDTLHLLNLIRRDLVTLHRWIWPMRDVINSLEKNAVEFIQPETSVYLRDVHDHIVHISDTINSSRDMLLGLYDVYLSNSSHRMNEVIKVLTIISTIFMPLTFIVGVYGMNFKNMPELSKPWAYPAVMVLMLFITIGMLIFFKRKKWI